MTIRKKILVMASICTLALLVATTMSNVLKAYEDRPFRVYGDATILIDWANPQVNAEGRPFVAWTLSGWQTCTEGWFEDGGGGILYLDTLVAEGSGIWCECNSDTITWKSSQEYATRDMTITLTSGTGRFKNISGHLSSDNTVLASELDADGNLTKLVYSFWGEGTVRLPF